MNNPRFDRTTQALHWFIALCVIGTYAGGLVRGELPKGDLRNFVTGLHISFGLLVFALTLVRIFWRASHAAPEAVPMPRLMQIGARAGHGLLYLATLGVPLVGILMVWAKGRAPMFFGLFPVPALIAPNHDLAEALEEAHEVMSHLLMLLAFGHALMAIYHQHVLKDGTLGRMLSLVSVTPEKRP